MEGPPLPAIAWKQIDEQAAQASLFYERKETIDRSKKRVLAEFAAR